MALCTDPFHLSTNGHQIFTMQGFLCFSFNPIYGFNDLKVAPLFSNNILILDKHFGIKVNDIKTRTNSCP